MFLSRAIIQFGVKDVCKWWLILRTHSAGVVSSNPARATIKTAIVRKAQATTSQSPFPWKGLGSLLRISATLEMEHATQFARVHGQHRVGEVQSRARAV